MKKVIATICSSTLLLLLIGFLGVYAESDDNEKLIYKTFFTVIGAEKQYNEMISLIQNQYKQGISASLQSHMAKIENADPEKKEAYIQLMNESMAQTLDRLMAQISEVMPFDQLVENIYLPVYKQHFSTEEIKEITQFFESPIGNKFVSTSPQLMQESAALLNQQYGDKIQQVSMKITQEEIARIKSDLKKLDIE